MSVRPGCPRVANHYNSGQQPCQASPGLGSPHLLLLPKFLSQILPELYYDRKLATKTGLGTLLLLILVKHYFLPKYQVLLSNSQVWSKRLIGSYFSMTKESVWSGNFTSCGAFYADNILVKMQVQVQVQSTGWWRWRCRVQGGGGEEEVCV